MRNTESPLPRNSWASLSALTDQQGGAKQGLALPGVHRVRSLWAGHGSWPAAALRWLRHQLSHLLLGPSAAECPQRQLEVQMVSVWSSHANFTLSIVVSIHLIWNTVLLVYVTWGYGLKAPARSEIHKVETFSFFTDLIQVAASTFPSTFSTFSLSFYAEKRPATCL